jgi:hypothetical protein
MVQGVSKLLWGCVNERIDSGRPLKIKTMAGSEEQSLTPIQRLAKGSRRQDHIRVIVGSGLDSMAGPPESLQQPPSHGGFNRGSWPRHEAYAKIL